MAGRAKIPLIMQETSQSGTSALITNSTTYNDGNANFQTAHQTTHDHSILGAFTNPRMSHTPQGCNIFVEEAEQNNPRHGYNTREYRPTGYYSNPRLDYSTREYRPPGYHPPIQEMGQNHRRHDNSHGFRPSGYSPPIQDTEPHTK